ncbi:hypothetical protein HK105_209499, partial [Polyrhizophydium stewartii]
MQRKKRSRHAGRTLPQTLFVKVLGDSRAQPIAVASGDAASGRALRTVADLVDAAKAALPHLIGSIDASRITAHLDEQRARAGIRLRSDMLLRDLPHPRDTPLPGSPRDNPLVVMLPRTPTPPARPPCSGTTARFKFLYPVATMTTISVLDIALCDGRIHIDSVLKRLGRGAVELQIIEGRPAFTIRQRPDGFSEQRFSSSATHYIYVQHDPSSNESVKLTWINSFRSNPYEHFSIQEDSYLWDLEAEAQKYWRARQPPVVPDSLAQMIRENLETSRFEGTGTPGSIATALLCHALSATKLCKERIFIKENLRLEANTPGTETSDDISIIRHYGAAKVAVGLNRGTKPSAQD